MPTKVTSLLLCDDVRKEASGKDILIGVYSGSIDVTAYPAMFPLMLWIEFEPEKLGDSPIRVQIDTPSGNPPIKFSAEMEVVIVETSVLIMGPLPITVERDGEILISMQFGDGPMEVVKRKQVRRRQASQS